VGSSSFSVLVQKQLFAFEAVLCLISVPKHEVVFERVLSGLVPAFLPAAAKTRIPAPPVPAKRL
jgi:hypothetical protein